MNADTLQLLPFAESIPAMNRAFHLAYYHTVRAGYQDRISKYLNDFKEGKEPQSTKWIELAASLLKEQISCDVIVRALASGETASHGDSPLDTLSEAIANACGCVYAPERLRKTRPTKVLQGLGGKKARQNELRGAYEFQSEGLDAKCRILVVDDLSTTATTLEVIAEAIRQELPDAEIIGFVLGKADGRAPNAHLDPDYFAIESNRPVRRGERKTAVLPDKKSSAPVRPGGNVSRVSPSLPPEKPSKKSSVKILVGGLVLAFLVLGALVPLRSGKPFGPSQEPVVDALPMAERAEKVMPPEPASPPGNTVVTPRMDYPQGIITVPSVGLRVNHSMESRTLGHVVVKNGERVFIVKKFSPQVGPTWMQIRTKSGKVGWVFASLVRERKGRV